MPTTAQAQRIGALAKRSSATQDAHLIARAIEDTFRRRLEGSSDHRRAHAEHVRQV